MNGGPVEPVYGIFCVANGLVNFVAGGLLGACNMSLTPETLEYGVRPVVSIKSEIFFDELGTIDDVQKWDICLEEPVEK